MNPEDIDDPAADNCSICGKPLRLSDTQADCPVCNKAICEDCTCEEYAICIGDDVFHKKCLSCLECVNYDPLRVIICKLGNYTEADKICDKFKESEVKDES